MPSSKVHVIVLTLFLPLFLTACGGGGGGGDGSAQSSSKGGPEPVQFVGDFDPFEGGFPSVSLPSNNSEITSCTANPANVAGDLAGLVRYQSPAATTVSGLNYLSINEHFVRAAVVELIDGSSGFCDGAVLATTLTDGGGYYFFNGIDTDLPVCVQVRAQMYRSGSPSWNVQVTDNTQSNAPYYLVESSPETANNDPVRNLTAATVWNGSSYDVRHAAPFAVLDGVCNSFDKVLSVLPDSRLPKLMVRWSEDNTVFIGSEFDLAMGELPSAFFIYNASSGWDIDQIFLRGKINDNTDEYDPSVIAHETAHYLTRVLSRSDSWGGSHRISDRLDFSVSWDEGWADFWSGVALDDSEFIDTLGFGQGQSSRWSLEAPSGGGGLNYLPPWYREAGTFELLWDLYDANNDNSDALQVPLSVILSAWVDQENKDSQVTLFSFLTSLRSEPFISGGQLAAFDALVGSFDINSSGLNDFGSNETTIDDCNFGGDCVDENDLLPIYIPLTTGVTVNNVCSDLEPLSNSDREYNKLLNYHYLRFKPSINKSYRFTAEASNGGIAGMYLFRDGAVLGFNEALSSSVDATISKSLVSSQEYVLLVYHVPNSEEDASDQGRKCFSVRVI